MEIEQEEDCVACQIERGEIIHPGGLIYETKHWSVDHNMGPVPVGTLIMRPKRHVYDFSDLSEVEAHEFSPLLHKVTNAMKKIIDPTRIYICCWADAYWIARYLHFHLWPRRESDPEVFGEAGNGPHMQSRMAREKIFPPKEECSNISRQIKEALS